VIKGVFGYLGAGSSHVFHASFVNKGEIFAGIVSGWQGKIRGNPAG
jgi:hypothetical protein